MASLLKITANGIIVDARGLPLETGTITFVATDGQDQPIPFRIRSDSSAPNRQAVTTSILRTVTSGSIDGAALYLAASLSCDPTIAYRITITDLDSGSKTVLRGVKIVDAGDGTWDLGSWNTGLSSSSVPVTFVIGPQGPPGTIAVGTVAGAAPGSPATVTNSGTPTAAVLNFQLPQGAPGTNAGPITTFSQVPSGVIDGTNTVFAVAVVPRLLILFLNRVFQIPGVDYTLSSSTITFAAAPLPGELPYAQGIY